MELNQDLTYWHCLMNYGGGLICFISSVYHGRKAWCCTPEGYKEHWRLGRPKSWRKWPIYNFFMEGSGTTSEFISPSSKDTFHIGVAFSFVFFIIGSIIFLK